MYVCMNHKHIYYIFLYMCVYIYIFLQFIEKFLVMPNIPSQVYMATTLKKRH